MAKKNCFSKLLTLTATVAAVGGACYVFRDKIKNSPLYKAAADKAYDLYDKWKEQKDTDDDDIEDWAFDTGLDEEFFPEEDKSAREYTSITINAKEDSASDDTADDSTTLNDAEDAKEPAAPEDTGVAKTSTEETTEPSKAAESDVTYTTDAVIPTIDFASNKTADDEPEVLGYENEGLSDVSEDPDVLEEQDKLDF